MTSAIGAVPAIGAIPAINQISATSATPATGAATSGSNASFGDILAQAIDGMQGAQASAQSQATQVAAGSGNLSDAMIASSEALLQTQLFVSVRNAATSALNQVLSTPV